MSATAKLAGGKVVAKLRPQYWHHKVSGEYNLSFDDVTCTAQLTWYIGHLYLSGYYRTPSTYVADGSGIKEREPSRYQIQMGWGKGAWKATATAYCFLRSSWETTRQELAGQYYQFCRQKFGTANRARFQIAVTYTLGYGRKVRRGDEVSGAEAAKSAILR